MRHLTSRKIPFLFAAWLLACALLISSCGRVESFVSQNPLTNGVRDKSWQDAEYLEVNALTPDMNASNVSFRSFDLAASDDRIQMVASFYDTTAAGFRGYGRLFDSSGWAPVGSGFSNIAAPVATFDFTHVGIGSTPGGFFLSSFADTQATMQMTPVLNNGTWQTQGTAVNLTAASGPTFSAATAYTTGPRIHTRFDASGRAYIVTGQTQTSLLRYLPSTGIVTPIISGAAANSGPTLVEFDGLQYMCAFSQDLGSQFTNMDCLDTSIGATTFAATVTFPAGANFGMGVGTNRTGDLMVVYNQGVSGFAHVFAQSVVGGALSGSPVQISASMPSGYESLVYNLSNPEVVGIGSGRYLAAWIGITSTASSVFYAVYDPSLGWSSAQTITGSTVSYAGVCPGAGCPYRSISLFGNAYDNAGIVISSFDATKGWKTIASRFQVVAGWVGLHTYGEDSVTGNGCIPAVAGTQTAACSMTARGAIMADGTTAIVFPSQDISGNYRLSGAAFK